MRLLGMVVELMKRSWTRLSRQKGEESSKVEKPQRPEKSARAIGSEEPSFLTSDTRLAFTKMGPSYTKFKMENYWPLLEAFQKWSCKHEILVLACYCSRRQFKDTKSSSSRRVRWTREIFQYHFRTNYQPDSPCQPASLTLLRA